MKKSVLDVWNAYQTVPIKKEDRDKLTFITPWGRYRYLKAPQGYIHAWIICPFIMRGVGVGKVRTNRSQKGTYKHTEHVQLVDHNVSTFSIG